MSNIRSAYTDSMDFYGRLSPHELAETYGTPLYVYNEKILRQRCRELKTMVDFPGYGVNYSVKANSNPALLKIIRQEGLTVDAMSPGELRMDTLAGFEPEEILYISNNNDPAEMLNAISHGCLVSADSLSQLDMLGSLRPSGPVMCRINPGIGAGHNAKVITGGKDSKFGIDADKIAEMLRICQKHNLVLAGLNQHIGSLFMDPQGYLDAVDTLLGIAANLPPEIFRQLEILDFGGGFGVPYHKYDNEPRLDLAALGRGLAAKFAAWSKKYGYAGRFLAEPGRYVAAECGLVLGRVNSVKNNGETRFVGTDIGFNVLQRPMVYGSFHDVEIYRRQGCADAAMLQTIVGDICESGDILAKDRMLPVMEVGDIVAMLDAGAYGYSMASNYNERLLPAEILINLDGEASVIRRRQTLADLEACLP